MNIRELKQKRTLISEGIREWEVKSLLALQERGENFDSLISPYKKWIYGGLSLVIALSFIDTASAITVENLKAPIVALKQEVFGGWMFVAKIGAFVMGVVLAIAQMSGMPFGIGCGISCAIHFMDSYIGDGSGAVI
jgi:hypothetical protein